MVSNQVLQATIDGVKNIAGCELSVIDVDGNIIAQSGKAKVKHVDVIPKFLQSEETEMESGDGYLIKIFNETVPEYILISEKKDASSITLARMTAFQIQGLQVAYRERFDRDNFIKNLLLDNLLLVDIYNRAKKLHVATDVSRCVIVVESNSENEASDLERIRTIFSGKTRDFVTAVDENNIIIVKELSQGEGYDDINRIAESIFSSFTEAQKVDIHIAYGTIVGDIKEVSRSFKEAKMALDVGRIFFEEKDIIAYATLGIGRLIYQLPIPLCKMFIKEIFENKSPDDFDEETLITINKFFENNLNVSETSRQLYIHRNTLVYRLDKIQKYTGLDLRMFENAITFKIALMVVKYMKYMENNDFK